jgi:hypothetical protein
MTIKNLTELGEDYQSAKIWYPESGDCLIGQLIGIKKASGIYGETHQILVQTKDGTIEAAWLTAWLEENMQAQNAAAGDLIALTYLGKKQSPSGRIRNSYSLLVNRAESQ